jgi:CTP:molybdopterin cytidylyltransferase MocA
MVAASVVTSVPATQETPQAEQTRVDRNTVVVSAPAVSSVLSDSLAEAARRAKQHQACLKLAADNPSITCK